MLPNLGSLALAPSPSARTGVTVNPDGSATLTPEEWAKLSGLIGGPSAPTPAPRRRKPRVVRHDDDTSSSSSEDERPLAARVPPQSKRRHRRNAGAKSRRKVVVHDDPDTLSDLLKEDELAAILGAIGLTEESKASACSDAQAWCALNKEHKAVCDSHPRVWQSLAERIFDPGPAVNSNRKEIAMGKGLIYHTFKDDAHPQKAFLSMCGATGLADVLEKRFVMLASERYGEMLWENWNDTRADITGLGDEIEDMDTEEVNKLAEENYPDIFKAEGWAAEAKALFDRAPPKALYLDKYRNDKAFGKLVDNLFKGTIHYLFVNPMAFYHTSDDAKPLDVIYMIGEVLGIYIVCLWKLERDRSAFEAKHSSDDDPMPADVLDTLLDEKDAEIRDRRTWIAYGIELILDPVNAEERKDYFEFDDFQYKLYEYETESEFDGGADSGSDGLDVD